MVVVLTEACSDDLCTHSKDMVCSGIDFDFNCGFPYQLSLLKAALSNHEHWKACVAVMGLLLTGVHFVYGFQSHASHEILMIENSLSVLQLAIDQSFEICNQPTKVRVMRTNNCNLVLVSRLQVARAGV